MENENKWCNLQQEKYFPFVTTNLFIVCRQDGFSTLKNVLPLKRSIHLPAKARSIALHLNTQAHFTQADQYARISLRQMDLVVSHLQSAARRENLARGKILKWT